MQPTKAGLKLLSHLGAILKIFYATDSFNEEQISITPYISEVDEEIITFSFQTPELTYEVLEPLSQYFISKNITWYIDSDEKLMLHIRSNTD